MDNLRSMDNATRFIAEELLRIVASLTALAGDKGALPIVADELRAAVADTIREMHRLSDERADWCGEAMEYQAIAERLANKYEPVDPTVEVLI